ncbi:short-chain dehydrogenase [Rhypophila sp. PSN 637]
MAGSIIVTGANGSLAIPAVDHLLSKYPDITAILTVRNTSSSQDANTKRLEETISRHPGAKATIHALDLASLQSVTDFANKISTSIKAGELPPLISIICNAYHWNLVGNREVTSDGYEKTFQVNHLSHASLVLRLLGSFSPDGGRVVLFSSDAHWPGKNIFERYPPMLPSTDEEMDQLVKDPLGLQDDKTETDHLGRGFQRYATSKLAITAWMYALNSHLEKNQSPPMSKITAIAINPGALVDSRATRTNTPTTMAVMGRILAPLLPLLRLKDKTARKSEAAGVDVMELALDHVEPGERGFFTMAKKDVSSPDSLDGGNQDRIWKKTLVWLGLTSEEMGGLSVN